MSLLPLGTRLIMIIPIIFVGLSVILMIPYFLKPEELTESKTISNETK
ncbi:hypothetical protein [Schnuerera ultunensis]|uniref:Uncharacterized protein n=1 Tax=[Clostridium] ultunense Esp TaxID=1288971 RepID=A0A1M4PKL4_9FIRM|nr:hypothetical protein [Schnuerera ultunensis]SHD75974.1 protein of unknown function [[Clostridium] ultunense Esp]